MLKKLTEIFSYNREKYENFLDDDKSKMWIIITDLITFLVLIFIAVVTFESLWNNKIIYESEIFIFDAFIATVFAIEYIYRLMRTKSIKEFFLNPIRFIDLLSFLPFFIWLVTLWELAITLRLFRILRVLRLVKRIPLTSWFIKSLKDYVDEYRAVFILYFVVLFLGSFFVYIVEKDVVWTHFTSIPTALWWWLVTITTVWYWDIYPITPMWKAFWSILVFFWPLVLALATSVTIMVFQETNHKRKILQKSRRWLTCPRCSTKNFKESNYCFICWKKFITEVN
jgi:hypothetical protein